MSALTLPQTNGSKVFPGLKSWQRESVKTFFTGVNWEDHTPGVQEIKLSLAEGSNEPLKLTMSVCQFFATINWEGAAIAAAAPVHSSSTSSTDDLTLDGFSGLF